MTPAGEGAAAGRTAGAAPSGPPTDAPVTVTVEVEVVEPGPAPPAAVHSGGLRLATRVGSAVLLLAALLGALFLGGVPLDIAVGAAALVGMYEYAGLAARCGMPPTPWVLYPLGGWLLFRFLVPDSVPTLEWGLGAAVVVGLLGGLLRRRATDAQAGGPGGIPAFALRWAAAVGGALYIGLTLGYYLALLRWHPGADADRFGLRIVMVVLAGAMLGDTAALFVGSRFGRHPFFPRVSPRKTVEGAIGGAAATLAAVALGMPWLVGLAAWQAVLLGAAVAVGAQGGDLVESALKRAAGAKDSSTLIPGHGGLLDRLDSLLLLGPVVYSFLRISGLP